MEEKRISFYELMEIMKKEKKRSDNVFKIMTVGIPIIVLLTIFIENFYVLAITYGIFYLVSLISFILINKNYDKRMTELEERQGEIDNYCVELEKSVYLTKESLMILSGKAVKNIIIRLDDIISVRKYTDGEGIPSIRIETKDKKSTNIRYKEEVLKRLEVYNSSNVKKEIKSTKVDIEFIDDFYIYDDYAEGIVYVPGLKTDCRLFVYGNDEGTIPYAKKTAKKVQEYTFADFHDALTCTVWAYNDFLKEVGYLDDLYKDNMPVEVTADSILDYMVLVNIASDDEARGIAFQFEVPWEVEHGFSWVFKGKELIYVGSGHDVYPDSDSSVLGGKWNYAKKYHSEVTLTMEEIQKNKEIYEEIKREKTK
jgi:hypothetical protein